MLSQLDSSKNNSRERTNQDWLDELAGGSGRNAQEAAHQDLMSYLYVVAYNYLTKRQDNIAVLEEFGAEELARLAQDFVQETIEKISRNQYELLAQYSGAGRFTSWTAQIITNLAASELRRPYWGRRQIVTDTVYHSREDTESVSPASAAVQSEVTDILYNCIEKLSERYRVAFLRCVGDGDRAEDVAEDLDITANAVYLLVYRSKRNVRKCIEKSGLGADVLSDY